MNISVFDIGVNSLMIKCDNIDRTIKFFYVSADKNNRKAVMAIFDTNETDFGYISQRIENLGIVFLLYPFLYIFFSSG